MESTLTLFDSKERVRVGISIGLGLWEAISLREVPKMKYSMTQWIFGGKGLEETLRKLKRMGFDGIELIPEPERFPDPEQTRALFDKYGIEPSMMDLTAFHDLSHPDENERKKALEINKKMLDITSEIGCKKMLVCGTAVGRVCAIDTYEREWQLGVESVRLLADYAAGSGVLFVMEVINHYETCLFYNVDRALQFMADVDHENLAVMVDTYHMNIEEDDHCRAIRRVADKLANFHIADSNRCGIGHGHIDFLPIMKALKEVGYDDYIGLEPQAPGPNPFEAIKASDSKETVERYLQESMNILRAIEAAI